MPHVLTPEDWISFKQVSGPQISPDGGLIAFVIADTFKASGGTPKLPKAGVYAVPTAGGPVRRLTNGPRSDTFPRWSPDGRSLAFLSDREEDGQRQVYLLPRDGGEARRLTNVRGTIPSPRTLIPVQFSPDGRFIAFLKEDEESAEVRARHGLGNDAIEFEKNHRYVHLWTVDIETGKTACVSPGGLQIWEFAISPDGKRAAAVVSDLPYEQDWYLNRLAVFELGGETARTVHQTSRQVAKPAWSPDGAHIAFLTSMWSDRGSDTGAIYVVAADGGDARDVTEGHDVSYERAVWSADGRTLLASANMHAGAGMVEIDVETGAATRLWEAQEYLNGCSMSDDGVIAAAIESPDRPAEVFACRVEDGSIRWRRLTDANPQAGDVRIGSTREVRWSAADGLEIQGLLVTPPGYDGANALPTVMLVHGGPTSSDHFRYQAMFRWAQIIACRGFAVFQPNYRGSVGWGLEFAERIIGDMGGLDFQDMLAGLDHLIEEGVADPDRLGIAGSSYGGFTACWAVTQTDRFKAAVGIASVTDYRSFHGHSYLHTWDVMYYGGSDPYDPEDRHARFSPINHTRNAKTPVLLLHGQEDQDVPVGQSHQFFRALKDRGVETELVLYPREPHVPSERAHLLDMARRIPGWFERWLTAQGEAALAWAGSGGPGHKPTAQVGGS